MSTTSASRAEPGSPIPQDAAAADSGRRVLVWDAPVRVFHWLAVLCFAGAWLTAESERWRLLHVTLGLTLAALVVFRVVWGLIGTRHARFASFVRGPRAVARYLGSLLRGTPERHLGHNPAGALAIVGLLGLAAAVTASGWVMFQSGGDALEEVHEALANGLLALVVVHVIGVVVSSWLHRENLVRAMVTGRKAGDPGQGARRAWTGVAALMLVAVLGFWWQQSRAPLTGGGDMAAVTGTERGGGAGAAGGEAPRRGERRARHRDDD